MLKIFKSVIKKVFKPTSRKRRKEFIDTLINRLNNQVAYGPFKGLKFTSQSWWSKNDRPAMLFGIYEQEVLNSLFDKPSTCRVIVDIGAADGYYPVGCLLSKQYDFAHAFEISELGQKCILDLAKLNNVESQIKINGEASHEALIDLFQNLPPSMILIDIEGAEFLLLTDEAIEAMRKHFVIIEIHDFLVENGEKELIKLNNKLEKYFRISKFTTGARDLSVFSELHLYSDQDRWSICSERRQRLMWWWRLDPLT